MGDAVRVGVGAFDVYLHRVTASRCFKAGGHELVICAGRVQVHHVSRAGHVIRPHVHAVLGLHPCAQPEVIPSRDRKRLLETSVRGGGGELL